MFIQKPFSEIEDLRWILSSPPLLSSQEGHDVVDTQAVFRTIGTDDISPFQAWVLELEARRRIRLGLYFEDLILYAIEHLSDYELLAHDVQVFRGAQTLGAFDFILRAPDGEIEHWEAAVKFFLQSEPSPDWRVWVGPNGRDSLHRKMTKMLGRQIHLSDRPEAQQLLEELKIGVPVRKKILSKGILFQPYLNPDWPIAHAAHSEQSKGFWIRVMDFRRYLEAEGALSDWKLRMRPDWMACAFETSTENLYSSRQLKSLLHGHTRALMLSEIRPCQGFFQELRRWFVVAETWPEPQLEH